MQHPQWSASIRRVVEYVDDNLEEDLSVDSLAEVALLSKYHFHRIFKAATSETLNEFVNRRRLERAVRLFKFSPELSVTNVALRVGFQSLEHFSRSFKKRYNVSPRGFKSADNNDPISFKNSKIYQELSEDSFYHIYLDSRKSPQQEFHVSLCDRPEVQIATISEQFGKDGSKRAAAYQELIQWAETHRWYSKETTVIAMSKDDIEVTPAEHYRMEFGIVTPTKAATSGRVRNQVLAGGMYALAHAKGDIQHVAQGWDYLYKFWLPSSGYRPADFPAVEIFLQRPEKIGWETFDLEIGFAVEKY